MRAICCIRYAIIHFDIYRERIVHNDFNNFCNTINKKRAREAVLETRLRDVDITCLHILIDMNIRYYSVPQMQIVW